MASFVTLKDRSRKRLIGVFATACVVETFLVWMQAWRGVPSHLDMDTRSTRWWPRPLRSEDQLIVVVVALTVARSAIARRCRVDWVVD